MQNQCRRNILSGIGIFFFSLLLAAGQTNSTAKKPATPAPADLPSEATVDSFLQQTFGYQTDLSWKIASINPPCGHQATWRLCASRQMNSPALHSIPLAGPSLSTSEPSST